MPQPTSTPAAIEWHYVITIQFNDGRIGTADGTLTVEPYVTRQAIYQHVSNLLTKEAGRGGNVIFYTADPNHI